MKLSSFFLKFEPEIGLSILKNKGKFIENCKDYMSDWEGNRTKYHKEWSNYRWKRLKYEGKGEEMNVQ
jgi:hypothetical protein